jgi:hypothetical protein
VAEMFGDLTVEHNLAETDQAACSIPDQPQQ